VTSPAGGRAYLVRGDDPILVAQSARRLVDGLVGERDPALVVEEHGTGEELDAGAVVDACTTPPFLVDRRVVVVRDAGRLSAADAARIADALRSPVAEVQLVLLAGGGTVPQALVKAIGSLGQVVDASAGRGRDRGRWLAEHLQRGPVRLDAIAVRRVEEHLGEDLGRLEGLLDTLAAGFGAGAHISAEDVEPYLGEAGAVPPWDLTDAIDAGNASKALSVLHRMLSAGGRPAPVILATVHNHFSAMLRLDGADAVTPEAAASLLGVKSGFVAKKALERARGLGSERIGQAIDLIAEADLDIKGRTALPPDLVLEILVARLARLPRSRAAARRVGSH
jgi:DNA polymerase-3 subunit delta